MCVNRILKNTIFNLGLVLVLLLTGSVMEVRAQGSEVPPPPVKPGAPPWNHRQIYQPASAAQAVAFDPSKLAGENLVLPTTLAFGPDDRLYVTQLNGLINAYTIVKNGPNDYEITDTEPIRIVKEDVENHDDDGAPNSTTILQGGFDLNLDNTRQITGIYATGTPANPVLYIASSDPRHGGGELNGIDDSGLDTNSGVISRITWNGSTWEKVDLVRGLPRSEENHAVNGIEIDEVNNILYLAVGGFTNGGAPSNNFTRITEYALSAAILKIDLDMIEAMPVQGSGNTAYIYDMPTVDDPTRDNVNGITDPNAPGYDGVDINDPFGGNNGLNQSKLVVGGPVQFHATGLRNPYDLVIMETPAYAGNMYTIDNGANPGWGGHPVGEGAYPGPNQGLCTNDYDPAEPGSTGPGPNDGQVNNLNGMHFIRELEAGRPYYAGHPTPIRGNPAGAGLYTYFDGAGTFRTSTSGPNPLPADWPPIPVELGYPAECDFRNSGVDDGSLVDYVPSTNGMAEYTASTFDGEIQGAILSAGFSGEIFIAKLNEAGDAVTNGVEVLFDEFGQTPLDVIAQGDDDPFPGTIWAITYGGPNWDVTVFEPTDAVCAGGPGAQDDDNDGYSNDDEIANGTNECSAGSKPSDNDGDFISNLTDPDDDNDGINDEDDAFAIDAANGIGSTLPIKYDLFNEDPASGFFGIGFTGIMNNGITDYINQFNPGTIIAGGTAGLLTFPDVTSGDALNGQNDQDNAFQFGVDVSSANAPFEVLARLQPPFFSAQTPQGGQSQGFFIGTGDQDNYLKVVLAANGGNGGIEVVVENAGSATSTMYADNQSGAQQIPDDVLAATASLNLVIVVDPAAGTAHPGYQVDTDEVVLLGSPISLSGATLNALQSNGDALAVGVISTAGTGPSFTATWDRIDVATIANDAGATVQIAPPEDINESTVSGGSIKIQNDSESGQEITSVTFDLSTALLPDLVFDPSGTAGDNTGKGFTANQGSTTTGLVDSELGNPKNGVDGDDGYQSLTIDFNDFDSGELFTFSIDIDPNSIKGASAPGPAESGSVSGLELSGTTVTINFEDGSSYEVETYRSTGSVSASEAIAADGLPVKPGINVPGLSTLKAKVGDLEQTVRVTGPANKIVKLLVVEAALFEPTSGLYDVSAFDANSVIAIQELQGTIGDGGFVDFDVTLGNSLAEGGINYIAAVIKDAEGKTGPLSEVVVLDYDPDGVATPLVRINAGGPSVTTNGVTWGADQYFSGGGTFNNAGIEIANTDDDALYQTERIDNAGGLTYSIPVPGDGAYNVSLHFAEIFFGAPGGGSELGGAGQRVFDVSVEGTKVITDLDIYDEVGAAAALVYTFENISVTDGALDILIESTVREGKLSAIEVSTFGEPSAVTATPNPINFFVAEVGGSSLPHTVTINNSSSDAITVTGVSFSGTDADEFASSFDGAFSIAGGQTGSVDVTFEPNGTGAQSAQMEIAFSGEGSPAKVTVNGEGVNAQPGSVLYRINAGGKALASNDGFSVWAEDQAIGQAQALGQARVGTPSPFVNGAASGNTTFGVVSPITLDPSVPGSTPVEMFQTERWDALSVPNMIWDFPVASGTEVLIRLYFAEIFLTAETSATDGPRLFDVAVNGTVPAEFENIDVFAEVGANVGIMKSMVLTSDGNIEIELIPDATALQNPAIKGIELHDNTTVSNEPIDETPAAFRLVGNYPNPFNPSTNVIFELPEAALVSVEVYDVMGRKVHDVPAQSFTPGSRQVRIDATEFASGIYLYRVIAQMGTRTAVQTGRMTFVK